MLPHERCEPRGHQSVIATQQLVGALAVEHHLDARVPRQTEHPVLRMDARAAERLVLRLEQRVEVARQVGRAEPNRVHLRARCTGGHPEPALLIEGGIVRHVSEGVDLGVGLDGAHGGHDRARVDAAGQRGADAHVAAEVQPHALEESLAEEIGGFLEAPREATLGIETPVAHGGRGARGIEGHLHPVRRGKRADAFKQRLLAVIGETEPQIVVRGLGVDAARDRGEVEQRLLLGGEREAAFPLGDVERLDSERIAGQQQRPPAEVEHGEREHSDQPRQRVHAEECERLEQHLGVALRAERDAARLEIGAELAVVVDLAIEEDRQLASSRAHRLPPRLREVDDREAAMPQHGRCTRGDRLRIPADAEPFRLHHRDPEIVRTSMLEARTPAAHGLEIRPERADESGDTAHLGSPS
jgi:hypothetical protein